MARPTKLTDAVTERIVQAIRAGNYPEPAARAAGISASTYYRWIARGQQERSGVFRDFAEAVARAEGESEVHAVAVIRRAMTEDWRAALAYVERRHPERWRRQQTTELVTRPADEQTLDLARLSDEDLKLLEELSRRAADPD
jgi:transposase